MSDKSRSSELRVKTLGNSPAQGKPRVYFTCAKKDFDQCFEPITNDILKCCNCAVYYLDKNSSEIINEETLERMQLIVIAVTPRLFKGKNEAIDTILPFCKTHNKQILPIVWDMKAMNDFNRVFTNTQFLNARSQDSTELPYQQKLNSYLKTALIGDDQAKKIRKAFDAYIFLSYRKKDRAEAQRLMRLIHRDPYCRDIAIWYDEYLTPGEDFNDMIRQALEKSDLFLLAVTPNLLEMPSGKPNYVMDPEYPTAKLSGKPILPAELVNTDKRQLKKLYKKIPKPLNADDKAFIKKLMKMLKKTAIEPNDDPEHVFFIGLAYLSGIDVEMDQGKAVELITSAAKRGLPEAVEKLAAMYRNGDAVKNDFAEAAHWQKKLCEIYAEIYEDRKISYYAYAEALENLAIIYFYIEDYDHAEEILNTLLTVEAYTDAPAFSELGEDSMILHDRFAQLAHRLLGDIKQKNKDSKGASEHYNAAMELMVEVNERESTVGTWLELSLNHFTVGRNFLSQNETEEAKKHFSEGLEICEKMLSATEEKNVIAEARKNTALLYTGFGDAAITEKNFDEAEEYYKKALVIHRQMDEEYKSYNTKKDLSYTLNRLGKMCYHVYRNPERGKEYLEESFSVFDEQPDDIKRDLFLCYCLMGDRAYESEDYSGALPHYLTAQVLTNELLKSNPGPQSMYDSMYILQQINNVYYELGLND